MTLTTIKESFRYQIKKGDYQNAINSLNEIAILNEVGQLNSEEIEIINKVQME